MTSEVNQVELTDQELEQAMGGGGIGGASVGTDASAGGPAGPSAGVHATGVGSGTIGIGAGIGVSQSSQINGPGGLGIQVARANGIAVGGGI